MGRARMELTYEHKHTNTHEQERTNQRLLEMADYWGMESGEEIKNSEQNHVTSENAPIGYHHKLFD